jgi:hypothetical protein
MVSLSVLRSAWLLTIFPGYAEPDSVTHIIREGVM